MPTAVAVNRARGADCALNRGRILLAYFTKNVQLAQCAGKTIACASTAGFLGMQHQLYPLPLFMPFNPDHLVPTACGPCQTRDA